MFAASIILFILFIKQGKRQMKRYAITGELIPDENGFLIEYKTTLRLLKMVQDRKNAEMEVLSERLLSALDRAIFWRKITIGLFTVALVFIII